MRPCRGAVNFAFVLAVSCPLTHHTLTFYSHLQTVCIKQILHLEICEHYSVDIKILSLLWSSVKSRLYML